MNYNYKVVRSKRRKKTTSIIITEKKEILVKAPLSVSNAEIDRFVYKNADWIYNTLSKLKKPIKTSYKKYAILFGNKYEIFHIPTKSSRVKINHTPEGFLFFSNKLTLELKKYEFEKWYRKKAKAYFTSRVETYCGLINVKYNDIKVKKVGTIWGSCSSNKNLNFNLKLILAPKKVIDYVIVHEVCHLVHMNHGVDFWKLVEKNCPDYKESIQWLKDNKHQLIL